MQIPRIAHFSALALSLVALMPAAYAVHRQLVCAPTNLRFGEVAVGQSETMTATVFNRSSTPVIVSTMHINAPGFSVSQPSLPFTLAPRQRVRFKVTFEPTESGHAWGKIAFNGKRPELYLHGWGIAGRRSLSINPPSPQFGNVQVRTRAAMQVILTNLGSTPVEISRDSITGAEFSLDGLILPLVLASRQSHRFNITFAPQSLGTAAGAVAFSNAKNTLLTVPLTGVGVGTSAPQLSITPTTLNFGSVPVGGSTTQTATLSASGASVIISSATSSNSGFSLSDISLPAMIPAGRSEVFTVTFTPRATGGASGNLLFASNAVRGTKTVGLSGVGGSSKTVTAASCSYADVNAVINGPTHTASNGDTIILPAGTCTWNSQLQISVLLHLIGSDPSNAIANRGSAGGQVTVLIDNFAKPDCNGNHALIYFNNESAGNGPLEIANFTIQGLANDVSNCNGHVLVKTASHALRVHDLTLQQLTADGFDISGDAWGVADHNSFPDTGASPTTHQRGFLVHHEHWQETGGDFGDQSWFAPDTMGASGTLINPSGGGQAMFFENNVFTMLSPSGVGNIACEYGGRCVVRYNDIEFVGSHGTDSTQRYRSVRHMEVYNNNFKDHGQSITGAVAEWRGGTGMFFNNTIVPTLNGNYPTQASLASYRRAGKASVWGSTAPGGQGGCWGNGPWDTNDGGDTPIVYYSGTATTGTTATCASGLATDCLVDTAQTFNSSSCGGSLASTSSAMGCTVVNTTQGWGSNIIANDSTSVKSDHAALGLAHMWSVGDSYQLMRATQCIDQGGVGAGILLSGTLSGTPVPASPANNVIDPLYTWSNTQCAVGNLPPCPLSTTAVIGKFGAILANRHYYDQLGAVGNGTVGTGEGTLSQMPSTCTPKVGYWATDQNTLYVCNPSNTWTVYYQPYTYPHPLTLSLAR
jgi:hypothetical protein